jgi:hypothetical protein
VVGAVVVGTVVVGAAVVGTVEVGAAVVTCGAVVTRGSVVVVKASDGPGTAAAFVALIEPKASRSLAF